MPPANRLETKAYDLAMEGNWNAIEWQLKWRRKEQYQNTEDRAPASSSSTWFVANGRHLIVKKKLSFGLRVMLLILDREPTR